MSHPDVPLVYPYRKENDTLMASVNGEVKELVNKIRSYGFQVAIDNDGGGSGGKYKVFKNGQPVLDPSNGKAVILPMTPSSNRWYENCVHGLIRARVLPHDPKKEGQMKKARADRPADVNKNMAKARAVLAEKRGKNREWAELIGERLQEAMGDLEIGANELARVLRQIGREKLHKGTSKTDEAAGQIVRRLVKGGTIPSVPVLDWLEKGLDDLGGSRDRMVELNKERYIQLAPELEEEIEGGAVVPIRTPGQNEYAVGWIEGVIAASQIGVPSTVYQFLHPEEAA